MHEATEVLCGAEKGGLGHVALPGGRAVPTAVCAEAAGLLDALSAAAGGASPATLDSVRLLQKAGGALVAACAAGAAGTEGAAAQMAAQLAALDERGGTQVTSFGLEKSGFLRSLRQFLYSGGDAAKHVLAACAAVQDKEGGTLLRHLVRLLLKCIPL